MPLCKLDAKDKLDMMDTKLSHFPAMFLFPCLLKVSACMMHCHNQFIKLDHKSNLQFRVVAQKVHEDLAEAEGLLLVVVDQGLGERRHQTFQNLSFLSLPARGQSSFLGH